jgi:transposase-like protein
MFDFNTQLYIITNHQGDFMTTRSFNNEAKIKLTQLVNEGMAVMQEVETLNEGLSDTIKAIAEELEIKPSILKKAIRVAYKSRLGETNKEHEDLNTILETVGKTL